MTQVWPKEPKVSLFATLRNPVGQGGGGLPQVKGPSAAAGVQEGRLSEDQPSSSQQLQHNSLK